MQAGCPPALCGSMRSPTLHSGVYPSTRLSRVSSSGRGSDGPSCSGGSLCPSPRCFMPDCVLVPAGRFCAPASMQVGCATCASAPLGAKGCVACSGVASPPLLLSFALPQSSLSADILRSQVVMTCGSLGSADPRSSQSGTLAAPHSAGGWPAPWG
jgi:hypothetical protein